MFFFFYFDTPVPRDTVFRTVLDNADYSLTTPNYPGNYPAAKTLYWVLTAVEGDRIQMNFNSFDLSLDDSVSVSLILSDLRPLSCHVIGRFSGISALSLYLWLC